MIKDTNGNIIDYHNRKQRRINIKNHHNVFTKQYHSNKSRLRSAKWLNELKGE